MDGPEMIWVARLEAVFARPFFRLGTGMFLKLLSDLTTDSTQNRPISIITAPLHERS